MRSNVSKTTVNKTAKIATSNKTVKTMKDTKVWNNIAPNISVTPSNKYRVRVCGEQVICKSKTSALATRKMLFAKHNKV